MQALGGALEAILTAMIRHRNDLRRVELKLVVVVTGCFLWFCSATAAAAKIDHGVTLTGPTSAKIGDVVTFTATWENRGDAYGNVDWGAEADFLLDGAFETVAFTASEPNWGGSSQSRYHYYSVPTTGVAGPVPPGWTLTASWQVKVNGSFRVYARYSVAPLWVDSNPADDSAQLTLAALPKNASPRVDSPTATLRTDPSTPTQPSGRTFLLSVHAADADDGVQFVSATVIGPNGPEPVVNLTRASGDAKSGSWSGEYVAPPNVTAAPVQYQVIFHATDTAGTQSASSDPVTFTVEVSRHIEITLSPRGGHGFYHINTLPAMPEIWASAQVVGITPTPPALSFKWTATVHYAPSDYDPLHGPNRTDLDVGPLPGATSGDARFTPKFTSIVGGELTFTVQTKLPDGTTLTGQSDTVLIVADNPSQGELDAALPAEYKGVLSRIARQESGYQQFVDGLPYWSSDDLGGVGMFQITNPKPTADQVWNWRANLQAAITKFRSVAGLADRFWKSTNKSSVYRKLVSDYQKARKLQHLPPLKITLRPFTHGDFNTNFKEAEMIAVRGYNGAAGTDPVLGGPLQEFILAVYRVPVEQGGGMLLQVDVNEQKKTGDAYFVRVPASQRPPKPGDPDYVRKVLGL